LDLSVVGDRRHTGGLPSSWASVRETTLAELPKLALVCADRRQRDQLPSASGSEQDRRNRRNLRQAPHQRVTR
jgi:hypothetical protein